jgi:UDP-N-acetylmuramate dehydrogenase
MMAAESMGHSLIDQLPEVRGRLRSDEPLAKYTWFRVGGPAEVLFEPADVDDLVNFLKRCPAEIDVTVIGGTSNILIRDGGIPGVVIRLGKAFADIRTENNRVQAGAAAADVNIARKARDAGIGGLEFLVGIPGVLGGALRMNAGAYEREIKDICVSAKGVTRTGEAVEFWPEDMSFSYRHSDVPDDVIFISATLQGNRDDRESIANRMQRIQAKREESQPVRTRTGGSTFANPEKNHAWKLVDEAGCRGLRIGDAMVSKQHCNFLVNTGNATAADIESLGEEVRRRVFENSGVELRWEIRRLGVPLETQLVEVQS